MVLRYNQTIFVQRSSPRIIRYSVKQGTTPCRAEKILVRNWWLIDSDHNALIFLDSAAGHIPQASTDGDIIDQMKFRLFPWADVRRLDQVYLVHHKKAGWRVPYGQLT